MAKVTFYATAPTGNTGDHVCLPARYYKKLFPGAKTIGVPVACQTPVAVYGGGTLAHVLKSFLFHHGPQYAVAWGVGCTIRGENKHVDMHTAHMYFHMYGRRDSGPRGEFLPCVSCKAPEFDTERQPTSQSVVYGHRDFPIAAHEKPSGPFMHNYQGDNLAKVLDFLGSGEVVHTSSFHGMLWAKWLGRKVKVYPYSSKFFDIPATTLETARVMNDLFAERVAKLAP